MNSTSVLHLDYSEYIVLEKLLISICKLWRVPPSTSSLCCSFCEVLHTSFFVIQRLEVVKALEPSYSIVYVPVP